MNLNYYTTSIIHLSLEPFHNAGLTPEQTKKEIEKVRDGNTHVWCEASGINRNWNVRTIHTRSFEIKFLVRIIEKRLNELLEKVQARD